MTTKFVKGVKIILNQPVGGLRLYDASFYISVNQELRVVQVQVSRWDDVLGIMTTTTFSLGFEAKEKFVEVGMHYGAASVGGKVFLFLQGECSFSGSVHDCMSVGWDMLFE